jgi:hypothetical protein
LSITIEDVQQRRGGLDAVVMADMPVDLAELFHVRVPMRCARRNRLLSLLLPLLLALLGLLATLLGHMPMDQIYL